MKIREAVKQWAVRQLERLAGVTAQQRASIFITDECFDRLKRIGPEKLSYPNGSSTWVAYLDQPIKAPLAPGFAGSGCYAKLEEKP